MSSLPRLAAAVFFAVCSLSARGEMRVVADAPLTGPDRYPIAVAVDPIARKAFVNVGGPRSPIAVVIDLDTLASRDIALPSHPSELLVDSAHGRVYALHGDLDLGLFDEEHSLVSMIDTHDETVTANAAPGGHGVTMAADFGRREIYVPDGGPGVTTIDADTFAVKSAVDVGMRAAGVAVDRVRQRLFVADGGTPGRDAAAVAMVDMRTGAVSSHPLAFGPGGASWGTIARPVVDEHTGYVYVQHIDGRLAVLRPPSYEVAHGYKFGDYARLPERSSLSAAWGRYFQVTSADLPCQPIGGCLPPASADAALRAVTGATGQVATTVLPMRTHFGRGTVVADDDGGDVYVVLGAPARAVLRIDPATLDVRETLASPDFDAQVAFRDPVSQRLFLLGTNRVHAIDTRGAKAGTRIARGYRHQAFDHYFVTADPVESRLIDDGRHGSDWVPGEDLFRVWTEPVAGSVPVCRFFSARFAPKSSHVYAPHAAECDALKVDGAWQYEGIAFHVALPDATGACPAGTEPLYRLYNQGAGGAPNHRYTASPQIVAAMAAQGWSAEGVGSARVFACTPALR